MADATFKNYGPGFLLLTTEDGETDTDWTVVPVQRASWNLGIQNAYVSGAFGSAERSDSLIQLESVPVGNLDIVNSALDVLVAFLPGISVSISGTSETLGLPDAVAFLAAADIPIVGFVPDREKAAPLTSKHALWMPGCRFPNIGDLQWNRIEGADADQLAPYSLQARGVKEVTNTTSGFRCGWLGAPLNAGHAFALPDLTAITFA